MSEPVSRDDLSREETIFNAAVQLRDADKQAIYLDLACEGNTELRGRIEKLLRSDAGDTFLERPLATVSMAKPAASAPPPGTPTLAGFLAAQLSEQPGDSIGRYKLREKLGEGGCGVVYMAEQEEPVRRKVALKIIKLGMDTRQVIARFEAERQALALMDHPNIAKVLDAGATETGRPYFVMELVGGVKITDYCEKNNLTTRQRLDLFIQVCHAIQHAHQKGLIHRDIKPSNVLVAEQDGVAVPKVIDFGIAKATEGKLTDQTVFTAFEQFLGTPAYMSPEQAQMGGLDVDTRSDIYSLGVLLYELLTGKTPFDAKELLAVGLEAMRRTICEKEPLTPSTRLTQELLAHRAAGSEKSEIGNCTSEIDKDLDWIVMKCLEKDRARRYETANGLARDVERHLNDEPVVAGPPGRFYRFRKMVRRNQVMATAIGLVALVLVGGIFASTWQAIRARRAEQEARRAQADETRQRQQAQTEATKSQQVARLLKRMLEGVGPSTALGRDTTMLKEILDKTAQEVSQELSNQPEVEIELRDILAQTYLELGQDKQAEQISREELRLARSQFGNEHIDVARALQTLAEAQQRLGTYAEAEVSARAALGMYRKLQDDPGVAEAMHTLAGVLFERNKMPECEALDRELLEMERRLFGNDSQRRATTLHNLGGVLRRQGKLADAEATYREALAIYRKVLGREHPDIAGSLNALANVLTAESKLTEAESTLGEALAMRRRLFGQEHPLVASSLLSLAFLLSEQGKLVEAENSLRDALAIFRKLYGNDHPKVVLTLNNLAAVFSKQGKPAEAEAIQREVVVMQRKLLGNEHEYVATALNNLASTLGDEGRFAEAVSLTQEALALRRKLFGDEHLQVANTLGSLANMLAEEGKLAEAEAMARDALAMNRKVLGEDHAAVTSSVGSLVSVLQKERKLGEAEALCEERLARIRTRVPANDLQIADTLAALVRTLLLQNKFEAAEAPARDCLTVRTQKLPDDWRTFDAQRTLGTSLLGQKKYSDAEPLLLSGYEGMSRYETKISAPNKPRCKEALQALVQLCEAQGKVNQAAEWKRKLDDFEGTQTKPGAPPSGDFK